MKKNKLLDKQILKYLPAELHDSEGIWHFIGAVNDSYNAFERDNELAARAFRISEEEYEEINQQLKNEVELKKVSICKLKQTISELEQDNIFTNENDSDDLPAIIEYLQKQIIERKKVEADLIEARQQAEELAKVKETFLVNMSHEIRTPMNAILGMSNQLAKTPLNSKQHFYLDIIQSASENLLIILNDILDISKIEAGKLYLENIGFELKVVLERSLKVFMHRAEEKGLQITSSYFDNNVSSVLLGDPYRINQILLNLISNAIKFTEKGSIDISCFVVDDNDSQQTIEIRVKDTGVGMEASFLKNVFQKFLQEDKSAARKYGGTGLGMAITKQLTEMMNGYIKVESEKNVGTTITVNITLNKGTKNDLPTEVENVYDSSVLNKKHILVVDDNEMNRLVASTILKSNSVKHDTAHNGKEAIEKFLRTHYDLILMDIQMPIMDGMEATKKIREIQTVHVPIIALTANALKGEEEKCRNAGMDGYLSKPFKEKELLALMAQLLKTFGKNEPTNQDTINSLMAKSKKQVFDLKFMYQVFGSNPDSIPSLLAAFLNEAQQALEKLESCINEDNTSGLKDITHRLKSNLAMLNAHDMRILAHKIETSSEYNIFTPELRRDILVFKDGLVNITEGLQVESLKYQPVQ